MWKRNALCSNGVPCRSRIRKRISPSSDSSSSSFLRAKETRAPFTTERSLAIAPSSRTKPWSRTGIMFSGITSVVAATGTPSVAGAYVGTSGFSYPTWKPDFYPAKTPQKEFLRAYAERLPSVELNATFYQLPSEERLRGWAEQTPPGFRFAVKMNRRATHFGDLSVVPTFCERVRVLGERLGPILVQLPPTRPRDDGWLALMLESLDPELEYAFEFRNPTWAGIEGVQL